MRIKYICLALYICIRDDQKSAFAVVVVVFVVGVKQEEAWS